MISATDSCCMDGKYVLREQNLTATNAAFPMYAGSTEKSTAFSYNIMRTESTGKGKASLDDENERDDR